MELMISMECGWKSPLVSHHQHNYGMMLAAYTLELGLAMQVAGEPHEFVPPADGNNRVLSSSATTGSSLQSSTTIWWSR